MNLRTYAKPNWLGRWMSRVAHGGVALTLLLAAFGPLQLTLAAPSQTAPSLAPCTSINIVAKDAATGLDIPNFRWMINLDNSHDNTSILWPIASYSPVVATGNQDNATAIVLPDTPAPDPLNLLGPARPDRGYLVTVLANDGADFGDEPDYRISGKHFKFPPDADVDGCDVVAELQPHPLPLVTLRAKVFHDNQSVTGTEDIPVENGLAGFHITVHDRVGEVVTDWYGNPICTEYDGGIPGGTPTAGTGGYCVSDANGDVVIPNLGPDKYAVAAIPPDGSGWIQTSTIEGHHEQDSWLQEGATGFAVEGELFGQTVVWFGFIRECRFGRADLPGPEAPDEPGKDDCMSATANTDGTGTINGRVRAVALDAEIPVTDLGRVVEFPYLALNNLSGGDEQVWMGRGNENGTFTIPDVPPGLYQLVVWDKPQDFIITFLTVSVGPGQTVPLGDIGIPDWFGRLRGYAYIDADEDGIRDPGERGLPAQDLDTRYKDGSIQYATFSDNSGYYEFTEVFPNLAFTISEVGYGRFKNTGAASYATTLEGDPVGYPNSPVNQDLGLAGLLQATINWAGLTNWIDWGKKAFDPDENGGIVGIVFNATTRNELNARLQANEDYEPGVPGVTVNLYAPVLGPNGQPVYGADGAVMKDHLANVYAGTDNWYDSLPTDCSPVGTFGRAPTEVQPYPQIWDHCLEYLSVQNQMRPGVFDGGYAFDLDCSNPGASDPFDPAELLTSCDPVESGWWVVEIVPPDGYQVVKEEDINVFSGDSYTPQIPPPPCAGPLHTVDVVDNPGDANFDPNDPSNTQGVYNPDFLATTSPLSPAGGSPYEGLDMPVCNARLVRLQNGQNANSDFFLFTDVPMPGRLQGLLTDDLHNELDPASPVYGDKRGIPNSPIGVRDYTGKLLTVTYTDEDGYFELLLPSTGTYNCPLPAGPCPGMYFIVGNDPGDPSAPTNWNPNYGVLALPLDIWPGLTTLADVAILPITGFVATPGSQFETAFACNIAATTPDVQAVSQPYGPTSGGPLTITGAGFGSSGSITLTSMIGVTTTVPYTSPDGTTATVSLPAMSAGPYQLLVTNASGATSPSGITFHVWGGPYSPPQVHVDINATDVISPDDGSAGNPFHSIEAAMDDPGTNDGDLVLVHPGVYFESIIIDENLKLQGYGPGVTSIDGRFFGLAGAGPAGFDAKVASLAYDGPTAVPHGQTVTVLAEKTEFGTGTYLPQIDGFVIRGATRFNGEGSGIYAHAYARRLQISNNLVQSNAGVRGGGIRFGAPNTPNPDTTPPNQLDAENDNVRIHHNRILNNGGVLLAGGLALFNGTQDYEIDHNVICGNYSAEYGGGISHFGFSSGSIRDNDILFNNAFDEGGGIMIAGELSNNPGEVSIGTGNVDIFRNRIQSNVTNDDGGGVRLLQPVQGRVRIINNMIVNNLATDTGGGIALDDALNVQIVNNTVARNVSTATAEDSDRTSCVPGLHLASPFATCPHGAGLVSEPHSAALMAQYSPPTNFSNPALFNNIFWENQAYYLDGTAGLFGGGLPTGPNSHAGAELGYKDLEVIGTAGPLVGRYNDCTIFGPNCPSIGSAHNISSNPLFVTPVTLSFQALAFAGDPAFITVVIQTTPESPQGNYHLTIPTSPALNAGINQQAPVFAPCDDIDGDIRPQGPPFQWDLGADERAGGSGVCSTPSPTTLLYFSTDNNTAPPGLTDGDDANIYGWDGAGFSLVFNASGPGSAGLAGTANIDALVVVDSDTFYMSFSTNGGTTVPAPVGTAQDEDIVKYDAGVWSLYFDGSDVGLGTNNDEDVDAFEILADGSVVVSTTGDPVPSGPAITPTPADEDLLRCVGSFGPATTCTSWTMYFEGSDILLTGASEDVDGTAVQVIDTTPHVLLSTVGAFSVTGGFSGGGDDVWVCIAATTGAGTTCPGGFFLYYDGSGLAAHSLDAFDLP